MGEFERTRKELPEHGTNEGLLVHKFCAWFGLNGLGSGAEGLGHACKPSGLEVKP